MNINQRQESPTRTISGKKIKNTITCTVKQIRSLSPQVYQNLCRQQTFQTDSFKQILTRRSGCPTNKENVSIINKVLKKIKEEPLKKRDKDKENKKPNKSNNKRPQKKSSTVSLTKLLRRDKSFQNKNSKSISPSRLLHQYRSGPTDKRNYLSNNASSKTSREVFHSKSMKNLTERNKNQTKSILTFTNKQQKKPPKGSKMDVKKIKKRQNKMLQGNRSKKQGINYSHTEALAKQFDSLLKTKKPTKKKVTDTKLKKKDKPNKSREKKIITSNENSKNFKSRDKFNSYQSVQSRESPDRAEIGEKEEIIFSSPPKLAEQKQFPEKQQRIIQIEEKVEIIFSSSPKLIEQNQFPEKQQRILQIEEKGEIILSSSPKLAEQKQSSQKQESSDQKLQDLSMQLLQYYEQKTQIRQQKEYENLDPSYQFIEDYLLNLFEYLRQLGYEYRQNFIEIMKTYRNLDAQIILKNLNLVTEDSEEDDTSFKLPMYKYLDQQDTEILTRHTIEEFNNSYKKLQRHQLGVKHIVEDIYLKMIVDAFNEALNFERPWKYIFTESSRTGRSSKMRIQDIQSMDSQDNQSQFSFYFANSMNYIYKWAHLQCGRPIEDETEQQTILCFNEASLKQLLQNQVKQQNCYDELLEVIVALSGCIFEELVLEMLEDTAHIYF